MRHSKRIEYALIKQSDIDRFWAFVSIEEGGCWLWTGSVTNEYGQFKFRERMVKAHRFSLVLHEKKDWLPEQITRHTCEHKTCVSHYHVLRGTQQQNVDDDYRVGTKVRDPVMSLHRDRVEQLLRLGLNNEQVIKASGLSRSTFYRLKQRLDASSTARPT